jgi:hypothetical protein
MAFIILIPRTAQGENHYWSQLAHSFFLLCFECSAGIVQIIYNFGYFEQKSILSSFNNFCLF